MKTCALTVLALLIAVTGCSRQPAANGADNAAAPAANAAAQAPAPSAKPAANQSRPAIEAEGAEETARESVAEPEIEAQGCAGEIGRREARMLADQCRDVSPATRPPCNVANSCEMIQDEIDRGCEILGEDAPEFCSEG